MNEKKCQSQMFIRCFNLRIRVHISLNSVCLDFILSYCPCRGVNECSAKCVHICFTSNHIFPAPPEKKNPTKLPLFTIPGYRRLTEPCVHRLHLQTFGPKVRSEKPRSCCLRGLVLKPPVRLPGPLPNPETWRRTAPKRMDKSQN